MPKRRPVDIAILTSEQLWTIGGRLALTDDHLWRILDQLDTDPAGLPEARARRARYGRRFMLQIVARTRQGTPLKLVFRDLPIKLLEDLPA